MTNIVKNTTFPSPLDLLAPHSCRGCGRMGSSLCDRCKYYILNHRENYCPYCKTILEDKTCPSCQNLPPAFIVDKRNSLLGTLIYDYKFSSNRTLAAKLAEILYRTLPDIEGKVVIVPLPTNTKHIRMRGLDHTLLLAKHLATLRGKNYSVKNLLLRTKNTTQVGSNKKARISQAQAAYTINQKYLIDPSITYLLLDDIWTTGASMLSAYQTLKPTGASKILLCALALS